MTKAEHTLESG